MELRVPTPHGELRLRQERVLNAGECAQIVSALAPTLRESRVPSQELARIDDETLPYCEHLRSLVARLTGVPELEHQEPWTGVRSGPSDVTVRGPADLAGPVLDNLLRPGKRTHTAVLYLAGFGDGSGAIELPTPGLIVTPEPGILIVWNAIFGHQQLPVVEPGWVLTTWVRDQPQPVPADEATVRQPVLAPV